MKLKFHLGTKGINLMRSVKGEYFRLVADVYGNDKNLTQSLISNGLGEPYDGSKKIGAVKFIFVSYSLKN